MPEPLPDALMAVRFAEGHAAEGIIEGILVPWGGSFDGKDSYRTYAARGVTDFCLDWFPPDARPLMYHHGLDSDIRTAPVGRMRALEEQDRGLWMQAQIDMHNAYVNEIGELVKAGALGLSSGAMAHLVEIDSRSGEWKRWPLVEGSLTPAASNLLATVDSHTFASHCRAAGIALPDGMGDELWLPPAVRALWSTAKQNTLPDSSFAYISPGGTKDDEGKTTPRDLRHLVYKDADGKPDAAHVKNALQRLDQTQISDEAKAKAKRKLMAAARELGIDAKDDASESRSALVQIPALRADSESDGGYEGSYEDLIDDLRQLLNPRSPFGPSRYSSIVGTYPGYVLVCCWDYDDGYSGDSDQTYWRVAYSFDSDGEPTLGDATQVQQTYVPLTEARAFVGTLALEGHSLALQTAAFRARTKDVLDRRVREGRVFSNANRKMLADLVSQLTEAHKALSDLLESTAPAQEGAATARAATPRLTAQQMREIAELTVSALA